MEECHFEQEYKASRGFFKGFETRIGCALTSTRTQGHAVEFRKDCDKNKCPIWQTLKHIEAMRDLS